MRFCVHLSFFGRNARVCSAWRHFSGIMRVSERTDLINVHVGIHCDLADCLLRLGPSWQVGVTRHGYLFDTSRASTSLEVAQDCFGLILMVKYLVLHLDTAVARSSALPPFDRS